MVNPKRSRNSPVLDSNIEGKLKGAAQFKKKTLTLDMKQLGNYFSRKSCIAVDQKGFNNFYLKSPSNVC